MQGQAPLLFWILAGMVIAWFAMVNAFFRRIRLRHPEEYARLGEPTLFWNNSIETSSATVTFIVKRKHRRFNDRILSVLSDAMLAFFLLYLALFLTLLSTFVSI